MLPRPRPAVQQDFQGKRFDRKGAKDATFNPQIAQMAQIERGCRRWRVFSRPSGGLGDKDGCLAG
jgi:hypothetical protein